MLLIKTNNFKEDIDQIDMLLFGRTDQETWQSEPIFHDGDMYIAYAPKIDGFAEGKDIIDLDPNNSAQSGEAPKESVVQPLEVKVDPVKVEFNPQVIFRKPDPVEVNVSVEKPEPISVNVEVPTPEINIKQEPVNINTEIISLTSLAREVSLLREQLAKPWWKRFLGL
jgi:hypothetical protein